MRRFDLRAGDTLDALRRLFDQRLDAQNDAVEPVVREILADVRHRGDAALLDYTRRFDFPDATAIRVPDAAVQAAAERIRQTPLRDAMEASAARIRTFHERQLRQSWMDFSRPGEALGQKIAPLRRVGIYVPGGRAAYPSTVLMVGVPAKVAGVADLCLATPPSRETGLPPDATLAAAFVAGIDTVYAVGGAQAIGAMAFGTESVPRVDKIVGPGNAYVNVAKRLVYGQVGIDMLAGPSDVALLLDESADLETAAADLICQTEHDPFNSGLVVSASSAVIDRLLDAVERRLSDLPRADIVRAALRDHGYVVVARDLTEAIAVVNAYSPEHLHIDTANPWELVPSIDNAGAILLGPHSGAAHGDYVAGPSHTLPTAGAARFSSPLNVDDFLKKTNILSLSADVAHALAPVAETFGEFEGLEGHARSARQAGG